MKDRTPQADAAAVSPEHCSDAKASSKGANRRQFLGRIGVAAGVAAAGSVLGKAPAAFASTTSSGDGSGNSSNPRVTTAYNLRVNNAKTDFNRITPPHTTSGDEERYPDKSANYSKGLLQDDIGVVNAAAWVSFKKAIKSGSFADWEAIITGGPRTQNGPLASYQYDLESADSSQFGNAVFGIDPGGLPAVPPFDPIASPYYGAQLVEQYWGALLRDVPFASYDTNDTAAAAAAELDSLGSYYRGPRDKNGKVTTDLLFRGPFVGETAGPYLSQLMFTPTSLGAQTIDQKLQTFSPGQEFMTDTDTFLQVQNGISTGKTLQFDAVSRYLYNGRGLAAYTHVDVLYQAYFTGLLVLGTLGVPANPGNPYLKSTKQNGFSTFGGPDYTAAVGEIAARALSKVWYQKWLVHLTHRPESGGGVLQQILSGNSKKIDATLNSNVLNSQAPQMVFSQFGTFLLPQAFPEGSPTHPSYPTGHGTVGGACITLLKFYFDGSYVIPNPMVPSADGTSLEPYTGGDQLTVNGELNKLAHNVTYGHGIHSSIHWRSDSDVSMLLGEAIALSWLQDRAQTYKEKFTIQLQRLDGSTATISNE